MGRRLLENTTTTQLLFLMALMTFRDKALSSLRPGVQHIMILGYENFFLLSIAYLLRVHDSIRLEGPCKTDTRIFPQV
jgi:hypothetical protein